MDKQELPVPGWYADPTGRNDARWWDGEQWRDAVLRGGGRSHDPLNPKPVSGAKATPSLESGGRDPAENTSGSGAVEPQKLTFGREEATASTAPTRAAASVAGQSAGSGDDDIPPQVPTVPKTKLSIFNAKKFAAELQVENSELRSRGNKLEAIACEFRGLEAADISTRIDKLKEVEASIYRDVEVARSELDRDRNELNDVRARIIVARDRVDLEDRRVYDYEHVAEASASLATELESVRAEVRNLNKYDRAIHATRSFTFNNSTAKGRTFVNQMSRIMLRSYNAEAENAAKAVKAGNLDAAQRRLSKAKEQIEKQGTMIDLAVDPEYHYLRLREIELASRHLKALAAEKTLERARREELREQRKAEAELRREKERLEKERAHYLNSIGRLRAAGDESSAEELENQLRRVEQEIENADYRAANVRAGYVYVISNIGAFGEGVVKIGMTRRLEPMDRVRELGDASVPFIFDVHALFFADDAVGVENALHRAFADQRINRVNPRKEFFRVTPNEVLDVLQEQHVSVLEFRTEAAAEDFHASLALREQENSTRTGVIAEK